MNHQLEATHLQDTQGAPSQAPSRSLTIAIAAVLTLASVATFVTMGAEFVGSFTQGEQAVLQTRAATSVHVVVVPEQDKTFHERHEASLKKADDDDDAVASTSSA